MAESSEGTTPPPAPERADPWAGYEDAKLRLHQRTIGMFVAQEFMALVETARAADAAEIANARTSIDAAKAEIDRLDNKVNLLRGEVHKRGVERDQLRADQAAAHQLIADFDAVTDCEAHPDLHEAAAKLLGAEAGECGNAICHEISQLRERAEQAERERDVQVEILRKVSEAVRRTAEHTEWFEALADVLKWANEDQSAATARRAHRKIGEAMGLSENIIVLPADASKE